MLLVQRALAIGALASSLLGCGGYPGGLPSEKHKDPVGEAPGVDIVSADPLRDAWNGCDGACIAGVSRRPLLEGLEYVSQVTGADSFNQTDRVGVWGTDMGSVHLHRGALYLAFGDTFGEPRNRSLLAPGHPDARPQSWKSNTMAYSTDTELSDGLQFTGWFADEAGQAAPMLPGHHAAGLDCEDGLEVTKIPTAGLGLGGTQYLWYMSIECWETFGWRTRHAGLAYSVDGGAWQMAEDSLGAPRERAWDSHFTEVAVTEFDSKIYVFGSPAGRDGGLKLARVGASHAELTNLDAYEYFDPGSGAWVDSEDAAAPIIEGPVGESSVTYDPYIGQWILMHLRFGAIVMRSAPALTGPWSAPVEVFHGDNPSNPTTDESGIYLQLPYAPMVHPALLREDGRVVYFLVSFWGTPHVAGSYNVHLMRMTLGTEDCGCG